MGGFDKDYVLGLAKAICEIPSPSGYCQEVLRRIKEEAKSLGLDYEETKKGNLLISFPSPLEEGGVYLGLGAHVDTLGAMVRSIGDGGAIAFTSLGGPLLPTLDGEYCRIHTRRGPVYTGTLLSLSPGAHVFPDAKSRPRDEGNMYLRLDEVVKTKGDVGALGIAAGDFISIDPKFTITPSGYIKSRFLDDKISVVALLGLLERVVREKPPLRKRVSFLVSTYEEVGHGAASLPDFDEFIAVDMGCVGGDLNCTEEDVSICAKDSQGPYDYDLTSRLIEVAREGGLSYAVDIYPFYSSDTSAALRGGNDFKGALVGPGVHASHGMERTHYRAVENTMALLWGYIQQDD